MINHSKPCLMLQKNKETDIEKDKIHVGIGVLLKSWTVTILTENTTHKTFTQPPSAVVLAEYLERNFPDSEYFSAYESGFSESAPHYQLLEFGIKISLLTLLIFRQPGRKNFKKMTWYTAAKLPVLSRQNNNSYQCFKYASFRRLIACQNKDMGG